MRKVVVPISKIFDFSKEYKYIEKSIKSFPSGNELAKIAKEVGFKNIEYKTIFFGQMGILIVNK